MSKLARTEFDNARILQTTQNDARRIFQRVKAAQASPARASIRWPFELVQNAHDAGPSEGNDRVEINFTQFEDRLIVSHTGKPFVAQELAALLSGGSSKEFDSEETTGRFGTGFLVTHAVSTHVIVDGVLATQEGCEAFRIELIRDGDEDSIVANIDQANEALENAKPMLDERNASTPTASFIYYNPDCDVAKRGLDRLEQALPYLYATCGRLGRVRINRLGEEKCFDPEKSEDSDVGDFVISSTLVNIGATDGSGPVTAVRVGQKDGQSALLTVLENCGADEFRVRVPGEGFARVFVTFPIAGTDFLPFNAVVDGNFATFQERDGIAMDDADKMLIDAALLAFPTLIRHAVASGWQDAHKLANLAVPDRPLSSEAESGELEWWKSTILQTAIKTASNPLVQTDEGLLPVLADGQGPFTSFPVPAIDATATDNIDYDTFHALVGAITDLELPHRAVAESWGDIARQWDQVGVPVNRLGLKELTDWVKESTESVNDLPINEDPFPWLANLFLLAADMNDQNVRDMLSGLLPDQYGVFRDISEEYLYADGGISPEVKDIAALLGEDLRPKLLHDEMTRALKAPGYDGASKLILELLDEADGSEGEYTESRAIELILDRLAKHLPDDSQFDADTEPSALDASANLVVYLAENDEVQKLRQCPLLTGAGSIVHLSGSQQIMAPVQHWPESAQPYSGLYPESRVLSDRYCDDDVLGNALESLISVGLVIKAPLFEGRRAELNDVYLLREMAQGAENSVGVTVRDAMFGQIAFLATDLVQRCRQDLSIAKLLLDFVLNVAAREDQSWRLKETFPANRSGERISLTLNRAIWPSELKVRSWIPVKPTDSDDIAPMPANESNLREILDPSWLKGNRDAVDLLHEVFGFRQLTLMLDGFGAELEDDLVELLQDPDLVKAAVTNPDAVKFASDLTTTDIALESVQEFVQDAQEDEGLLELLTKRREQRLRVRENQKLGASVEDLVSESLRDSGFSVRRTGIGSDFEIAAEIGDVTNLEITKDSESWLVEVKATRDQRVRMTDTQAKTAVTEGHRFLLCVVPVDSEDASPEAFDVRADMRFVSGIGDRVSDLCNDLGDFEEIRADITANTDSGVQLEISPGPARVRVARSVWEDDGFTLHELAIRLSSQ